MKEYEMIVSALMVLPKGEPIFSEQVTTVSLQDEAAGLFVEVTQQDDRPDRKGIAIMEEEWPMIRQAINEMMVVCTERNKQVQP